MAWYMLTIIGADRPRIVAEVTSALFDGGCNLGEASAIRLGGYFATMLMVRHDAKEAAEIEAMVAPAAERLDLVTHVAPIAGRLHDQRVPDVRIRVFGADRPGIVARATSALADAGLNIIHLESAVGGSEQDPIYVMHIEGQAAAGIDRLRAAVDQVREGGVEATIEPVEVVVG